jgi:hypothetical protein
MLDCEVADKKCMDGVAPEWDCGHKHTIIAVSLRDRDPLELNTGDCNTGDYCAEKGLTIRAIGDILSNGSLRLSQVCVPILKSYLFSLVEVNWMSVFALRTLSGSI